MAESQKTKTKIHLALIRILEKSIEVDDASAMQKDINNIQKMSTRVFFEFLNEDFKKFDCKSKFTRAILIDFSDESRKRKEIADQQKLQVKVKTEHCGRCGEAHHGYTIKLDSTKVPYVVCGTTHNRIDVHLKNVPKQPTLHNLKDMLYATVFEIEDGDDEDINKLHSLLGE